VGGAAGVLRGSVESDGAGGEVVAGAWEVPAVDCENSV